MTRIMIMGDSWARGEWGKGSDDQYQVLHPGTRRFLEEAGHSVISVADAGTSNWAQLDRISPHHSLQRNRDSGGNLADADLVLWFVTDPLRDLRDLNDLKDQDSWYTTMADFQTRPDSLLEGNMDTLRGLVGDRPVWIVGGVGVIPSWVQARHPRWRVIVPDLMRWLVPGSDVSVMHLNRCWRYENCDEELLDYHEKQEQRVSNFRWRAEHRPASDEHKWFWPDGAHPNREAHRKLTQELILPLL